MSAALERASRGSAASPSGAAAGDARPGADPTRPPRGASSWGAVYRRVHDPDRRIAIASDVGACVDPLAVGDGSLWMWGVDDRRGMFGIRRADEDGRDLDPEEDEVYAESSTFAGFAPPGTVRRTAPAPLRDRLSILACFVQPHLEVVASVRSPRGGRHEHRG